MVSCYRSLSCSLIAICSALLRPSSSFVEVTCQTGLWVMGRCSADLQFPGVLFVFAPDCRPHSLDITVVCQTSEVIRKVRNRIGKTFKHGFPMIS